MRWNEDGRSYEPDQRHAEIAIRELGLESAEAAATPSGNDEAKLASAPLGVPGAQPDSEAPGLPAKEASAYQGVAARLDHLAQDSADIQYACKEASGRMARPREGDWAMLKRIEQYIVGNPWLVLQFAR